jgi:DNA-binding NarL/FixJ family response regulator
MRKLMSKKKIMIIDDHPLLRDAWEIILESGQEYDVTDKIGKSPEVVDLIKKKRPAVVLLDTSIAIEKDSLLIRNARKYSPLTRIIVVSVQPSQHHARKLLKAGATGFITRNCHADEILRAVETVLRGKTYVCKNLEINESEIIKERADLIQKLTKRELQIIEYLRKGLSSREISNHLSIAIKTVQAHRHNILKKLHVKNTNALIQFINASGL